MRENRPVEVSWDDALEAWTADATAPGSGADPASGPAGPAGVNVLRSGAATVSQCTMTGRVTSLWFDEQPSGEDSALLGLVVDAASLSQLDQPAGSDPYSLRLRPVAERIPAARLAVLDHARQHVPMEPGGAAEFLLQAELAAVLGSVHQTDAGFVDAEQVSAALDAADALAESARGGSLLDRLPPTVGFDPHRDRPVIEALADQLGDSSSVERPAVALLRDTAHQLSGGVTRMGGSTFQGALAVADPDTPTGGPQLFAASSLAVAASNDEPEPGRVEVRTAIGDDGAFALGDLAPRQVGLQPAGGSLAVTGSWCTITQPLHPGARQPVSWWVTALRGDRPVGSAPFGVDGDDAVARFAVEAPPDGVVISGHPLRPQVTARLRDLEAADRLSRAAWWARRLEDPIAATWFARSALAWLGLGRAFRAGWAWRHADQKLAHALLAQRAEGDDFTRAETALRAAATSGDVPAGELTTAVPAPVWIRAIDLATYAGATDGDTGEPGGN